MLFHLALLLLVSEVLVVPAFEYQSDVARYLKGHRKHHGNDGAESWAGAIWSKHSGTFTSVTGTFIVPTLSGTNNSVAAVWVGIDGTTCQNAILQTGLYFTFTNGLSSCFAVYEWFPSPAAPFSDISFSAGDTVRLTVTAFSKTSGSAKVENLTNGQTVSQSLTSTAALCQQNAEWIVEDQSPTPLANFNTVTFSNAIATGRRRKYTPHGAAISNIRENNQVLTSVSTGKSSVTINYV